MRSHGRRTLALLGVVALVAAGCSSPKPKGHDGGTLYDLEAADFAHLDPGRVTTAAEADYGRLLYRTLTSYGYSSKGGVHLVPDLATTTGVPTEGGAVWTFQLRSGLTYQDGTAITAADVKHGVERSSATGPLRSRLLSLTTPDPGTLVFRFRTPFVDFPYAAALPATAPVPLTVAAGGDYDTRIVSSGPYRIETYDRGAGLVLVRNEHWDGRADQARRAFPDRVVTTFGLNPTAIYARLIGDKGQDRQAVSLSPVPSQDVEDVVQGAGKRATDGYDNGVSFLAFNTSHPVLADVKVRQALEWAFPHVDARAVESSPAQADIATGVVSPALGGAADQDVYKTIQGRGDPAATRQLLAEAGVRDLRLTYSVPNTPTALATAAVVASAYRLAGVTLTVVPDDGTPSKADLVGVSRQPPWPSASAVVPALFPCATCDPALQLLLQQAAAETDLKQADKLYAAVDKLVVRDALVIPQYFTKALSAHGSSVRNTTPAAGFDGLVDLANLSVR